MKALMWLVLPTVVLFSTIEVVSAQRREQQTLLIGVGEFRHGKRRTGFTVRVRLAREPDRLVVKNARLVGRTFALEGDTDLVNKFFRHLVKRLAKLKVGETVPALELKCKQPFVQVSYKASRKKFIVVLACYSGGETIVAKPQRVTTVSEELKAFIKNPDRFGSDFLCKRIGDVVLAAKNPDKIARKTITISKRQGVIVVSYCVDGQLLLAGSSAFEDGKKTVFRRQQEKGKGEVVLELLALQ